MLADKVPNQFPKKATARRIAIVGEAAGLQERSWHICNTCKGEFPAEWTDQQGYHKIDHCNHCFGRDITSKPTPFKGPSGWQLEKLLAEVGIEREACFVGNCCQVQSPGNDITRFKWHGEEIQSGLRQLRADLALYQPHFCLLLGNTPLRAFKGEGKFNISDWRGSLFETCFVKRMVDEHVEGPVKCMPTYHPAALLREAGLTGVARFDFKRAAEEARTDALDIPVDDIAIDLGKDVLVAKLRYIYENDVPVAVDLEGYCNHISCIGFADGPNHAFVVPFIKLDNTSYWEDENDEVELWEWVAKVIEKPTVPKTCHNGIYESFVLLWTYGIVLRGMTDDTMVMWFEYACELEKSLGFVTSIMTKQPAYKFERKTDDERVALFYNGKDCCRTFEVKAKIWELLMPKQREHYRFNIQLLTPLVYMMARGIKYDTAESQRRLQATQKRIYALQDRINREAAASRPALAAFYTALKGWRTSGELVADRNGATANIITILVESFCLARRTERRTVEEHYYEPHFWNGKRWVKKGKRLGAEAVAAKVAEGWWQGTNAPGCQAGDKAQWWLKPVVKAVERNVQVEVATFEDVLRFAKDSCRATCKQALAILRGLGQGGLLPAQRGELTTLLGIHVKVNATNAEGDAQWFLYEHCRLPKQFKKENGRLTDRLASDDEAIIKAWVKVPDRRAIWFLNLRQLITSTKSLAAEPDADGRIRCGYNGVGAETHRLTCYGSPTGSSDLNLQTVTKGHRVLYRADDDHYMAQRDLGGADGWTVAAFMAMLGDDTMLRDYAAKLKPAQILVLMLDRGAAINKLSRDELKPLCKPITEEADWRYFAMKRVQHGGSYMMWKNTMSNQILTDSFKKTGKPIYVPPNKCEEMLTKCLFVRYPGIQRWHAWMERELKERGKLVASDGFQRQFYGRKDDKATVKAALAHLPQYYTTRATMLALMRLWGDAENRRADGSLRVEPLHTVHDSLVTQFRKDELDWARGALDRYFQNPMMIAQTMLTIPASGTYGESWGQQDNQL